MKYSPLEVTITFQGTIQKEVYVFNKQTEIDSNFP